MPDISYEQDKVLTRATVSPGAGGGWSAARCHYHYHHQGELAERDEGKQILSCVMFHYSEIVRWLPDMGR